MVSMKLKKYKSTHQLCIASQVVCVQMVLSFFFFRLLCGSCWVWDCMVCFLLLLFQCFLQWSSFLVHSACRASVDCGNCMLVGLLNPSLVN